MRDASGDRRSDGAIGKLQLRRGDVGVGLLHLRLRGGDLGVPGLKLRISAAHRLARSLDLRLRRMVGGDGVVHLLARHGVRVDRGEPLVVLLRLHGVGLGDGDIRPRLVQAGLQHADLRLGLPQCPRRIAALRLRLVELRLVVARVDQHQCLSRRNMLVVGKFQRGYRPATCGANWVT